MAYSRIFRKSRGPLSSRTRHSNEAAGMGSSFERSLENRLAEHQSERAIIKVLRLKRQSILAVTEADLDDQAALLHMHLGFLE